MSAKVAVPTPESLLRNPATETTREHDEIPEAVHTTLRVPGRPLSPSDQAFLEPRIDADWSRVPVSAPAPNLELGRVDDPQERQAEAAASRTLTASEREEGTDLSGVRVHTGPEADAAARAIDARAFSVGNRVVFRDGEYQPGSPQGRHLLAHELAHVAQPGSASTIRRVPMPTTTTPAPPMSTVESPAEPPADPDQLASGIDQAPTSSSANQTLIPPAAPPQPLSGPRPTDGKGLEDAVKKQTDAAEQAKEAAQKSAEPEDPKVTDSLDTGGIALIDEELAEHERWGSAAKKVGAAQSDERAGFLANAAAGDSGFMEGFAKGAGLGAGMKLAEKAIEKGAVKFAARAAARLGTQAAKFTPLPAVGAVIGGVMSAYDLASRDWKATGETIGRIGQGEGYEGLANMIEAVSTIIDVTTAVLNVIAGIIGGISIAMWAISVATVGIASPLAATLSAIAAGIGIVTLVLDAINASILKQLVTIFRILHAFESEADPRDVVTQGKSIGAAAAAASGGLGGLAGGLAGGKAAEKGMKHFGGKPSTPVPDHPSPPAASGDGPSVKAEPVTAEGGAPSADAPAAKAEVPVADAPVADGPTAKAEPVAAPEPVSAPEPVKAADPAASPDAPKAAEAKTSAPDAPVEKAPVEAAPTTPVAEARQTVAKAKEVAAKAPAKSGGKGKAKSSAGGGGGRKGKGRGKGGGGGDDGGGGKGRRKSKFTDEEIRQEMARDQLGGDQIEADLLHDPVPEPYRKPGDPDPMRVSVPPGWRAKAMKMLRKAIIEQTREALIDNQKMDAKIQAMVDSMTSDQIVALVEHGQWPEGFHASHMMPFADYPDIAHKGETATGEPGYEHMAGTHDSNVSNPLETLSPRNDKYRNGNRPGFAVGDAPDVLSQSKLKWKQAEGDAKLLSDTKNEGVKRRNKVEALRSSANDPKKQISPGQRKKMLEQASKIEKEAAVWEKAATDLEAKMALNPKDPKKAPKVANDNTAAPANDNATPPPANDNATPAPANDNGTPAPANDNATPAPANDNASPAPANDNAVAPVPANDNAVPPAPSSEPEPASPPTPAPAPEPAPAPAPAPEPGPAPKAEPEPAPAPAPAPESTPDPKGTVASPSPDSTTNSKGKKDKDPFSPPTNVSINVKPEAQKDEPSQVWKNLGEWGHDRVEAKTDGQATAKKYGGRFIGGAIAQAMQGSDKAKAEPVVEHVNPNYEAPPGTPQQVADFQNEALEALDARKKAEAVAQAMGKEERHHKANEAPLEQAGKKTEEAISAADAHAQAVQRRADANAKKKEKEKEVGGKVAEFSGKAGKFASVTAPMKAFGNFAGLASSLPDSPDVLVSGKRGLLKMSGDIKKFLGHLDSMEKQMAAQKTQQVVREQGVDADAKTIKATDSQAKDSDEKLECALDDTTKLDEENQSKGDEAKQTKQESQQTAASLDRQAKEKTEKAQSLAAALQSWAQRHKGSRKDSLDATVAKYKARNFKILEVKEK